MRIASSCALVTTVVLSSGVSTAAAATDCAFAVVGNTWRLAANCQTDQTLTIPDGVTLDGRGRTVTAVDPPGAHFLGAVVRNAGATAYIVDLTVSAAALSNVCDAASPTDDRLRGILLHAASGALIDNRVIGVRQVDSGCQEGFSIDVRNPSANPPTQVEISGNRIEDYQKAGIVVSGAVEAAITDNRVSGSGATSAIAQNGIQLSGGARGQIVDNRVSDSVYAGTETQAAGILISQAGVDVEVSGNRIDACDAGIAISVTDGVLVSDNRVTDAVRFGVLVQGNDSALLANRVQRSDGVGIYIVGEANTVEDNIARNSLDLDVYNEGANDYLDNRCDTSSGPPVDCGSEPAFADIEAM
jgi:nitrous oxidase accessory protein NosD